MSSLIGLNQLFCPRSRRTLVAWHWKKSPPALFWWSASTRRWLICLEMLCRWLLGKTINRAPAYGGNFEVLQLDLNTNGCQGTGMKLAKQNETTRFSCIFNIKLCYPSLSDHYIPVWYALYLVEFTGCFFHWYLPKKLKYGKPRLGESTLT